MTNMIEIKHRYTGITLKEVPGADLRGADLRGADLRGADLRGANLYGADLYGTNLREADLYGATLQGADLRVTDLLGADLRVTDLRGATLQGADLRGANLYGADLRGANLQGANLRGANLRGANLRGANLRGADLYRATLREADVRGVRGIELIITRTRILPAEGEIIGWKKCRDDVIVKLRIPADAKRSHAFGRKCRAEFVDVLEVIGAQIGISLYDGKTEYRTGQRVVPDRFDGDWMLECGSGIHFFLTRAEAEVYPE